MAARKWIEFVRQLRDIATTDLDAVAQEISDAYSEMNARSEPQRRALANRKLNRARNQLRDARDKQAEVRAALLLDEED